MPCLVGWQEGRCLWWTPLSCQLHCTNAVSIDVRMLTVPASGCCKAGPQAGRRTALATHAAHSLACAHTVTRAPLTSWARRRGLQCRQGTPTACMHACMHAHTHTHTCMRARTCVTHTCAPVPPADLGWSLGSMPDGAAASGCAHAWPPPQRAPLLHVRQTGRPPHL